MYDSLAVENKVIKSGGLPTKFPDSFLKIHTAKPTTSNTKPASFDNFATDYINAVKVLYSSPKEDAKRNYNLVVQKCESCHQISCPGPLKKINALKI